jgi:hypothetical protein
MKVIFSVILVCFALSTASFAAQPDTLKWDDGNADKWRVVSKTTWDNNMMGIKFTSSNIQVVTGGLFFLKGDIKCKIAVRNDSSGVPASTDLTVADLSEDASDTPLWYTVSFDTTKTNMTGKSAFWLILKWNSDSPDSPLVGEDTSTHGHSFWYTTASNWSAWTEGEWMFRALVLKTNGFNEGVTTLIVRPASYINQPYPNPVRDRAVLTYSISNVHSGQSLAIDMYDITGKRVKRLTETQARAGLHRIDLNRSNIGAGVYFIRLKANDRVLDQTKCVILP